MKIILKETGQILNADRIFLRDGSLHYENGTEVGEVLLSSVDEIVDSQTYDDEQAITNSDEEEN